MLSNIEQHRVTGLMILIITSLILITRMVAQGHYSDNEQICLTLMRLSLVIMVYFCWLCCDTPSDKVRSGSKTDFASCFIFDITSVCDQ